jgi:hypothetical protein
MAASARRLSTQGVPPPLLISDASCLDVVERLRRRLPWEKMIKTHWIYG